MPSERKRNSDGEAAETKSCGRSSRDDDGNDNDSKETTTLRAKADAKDSDNADADADDSDLVNKVIAFFFDDDAFAQTFERFAETHCDVFDVDSDEMKLEYTDVYNEFVALFEAKLEAFIASQGSSTREFYRLVRQAYARDRESQTVLCAEILVATADFDVFVVMMKQTKESLLLAKR